MQLAKKEINLQLAKKEINLQLAKKEINLQLAKKEINLQLAKKEINLHLAKKEINLQLAKKEINLQLAKKEINFEGDLQQGEEFEFEIIYSREEIQLVNSVRGYSRPEVKVIGRHAVYFGLVSSSISPTQDLNFDVSRPFNEFLYKHGSVSESSQSFRGRSVKGISNFLRGQMSTWRGLVGPKYRVYKYYVTS